LFNIAVSSKLMQGLALAEIVKQAAALRYDGLELWLNQVTESGLAFSDLRRLVRAEGLAYRVHVDTRDVNIASTNRGIREESIGQMLAAVEQTARLEATVLTIHPGRLASEKEVLSRAEIRELNIDALRRIARRAEQCGVTVGVENMEQRGKEMVVTEEDLAGLLQAVNSPSLQATLDIAHLHSAEDVYRAVAAWRLPLVNVHISQSDGRHLPGPPLVNGQSDGMHLPIYAGRRGTIDYARLLPLLAEKYQGLLVIEGYVRGREEENVRRSWQWFAALGQSERW
jgi:sugar phosphate isomerase/epimerase